MIVIVSERRPGEPKLKKPKELKGIKPFTSYKWGGVTTCQAFINGDDLWINHHDWCSVAHYGVDAKYRKKHFVYSDGFTAPVSKGDAWIRFGGILKYPNRSAVIRDIVHECLELDESRFCMDDERMFVDVYIKAKGVKESAYTKD